MNNEIIVRVGNADKKIFLQNGFYDFNVATGHIHKHKYSEIHIIADGKVRFYANNNTYNLEAGHVFAIPANTYHGCLFEIGSAKHVAFQIDSPVSKISKQKFSTETLANLLCEIENCKTTNNYTKIAAYLSLICADFYPKEKNIPRKMTDYAFIIYEFFSVKYCMDTCLSDLADELHLSEKQTERLIKKYTGNTFRQELVLRRMNMADYLLKTQAMSLTEIAQYVGYSSYSGFWKAYKKHVDSKQ